MTTPTIRCDVRCRMRRKFGKRCGVLVWPKPPDWMGSPPPSIKNIGAWSKLMWLPWCADFLRPDSYSANYTNLVLIPMVENPTEVGQFRHISLCNVSYKIVAKILAGRLRMVLPKIILGHQNAFVPNRQIHENIILVHEVMHTLWRKQGQGGLLAAKIDLEEAYDKVNWGF